MKTEKLLIALLNYETATVHYLTIVCEVGVQNEEIEDHLTELGYRLGNCNWMSSKKPIEIIEHGITFFI